MKTSKQRFYQSMLGAGLAFTLAACGGSSGHGGHGGTPETMARTPYGETKGLVITPTNPTVSGKTLSWLGLPFAKPPVGELRWRAPQPPAPWSGVREASEPAAPCTQAQTSLYWERSDTIIGSEDCLYLDVYRPERAGWRDESLPVYLWIHGGSNNFGRSQDYYGANLANQADAVVVVVQYRLGPLGWFFQPAVQTKGADLLSDSGNFGNLDNIRALQWVREAIAAFGGDPDNITVAGESSGAHNTMNLLVSPEARGLFEQAIVESPSMDTLTTSEATAFANQQIEYLIRYKGDADTEAEAMALRESMSSDGTLGEYLYNADAKDFFAAIQTYSALGVYGAVEDGEVVPEGGWMPAFRSGNYNRIPIVFGTNQYEAKSFQPLYGPAFKSTLGQPSGDYSWYDLIGVLQGESKQDGSPLTYEDVLPTERDREVYEATGYHASRAWRAKFIDELATVISQHQDNLYAYEFRWGEPGSGPEPFDKIYGSGHAGEIPFFHGNEEGLFDYPFTEQNEAGRRDLQDKIIAYEANFMRAGDPNGATPCDDADCPVAWTPWSNSGDSSVIILDADLEQARIKMSDEVLTLSGVEDERDQAISAFTVPEQQTVKNMLPQNPWPSATP